MAQNHRSVTNLPNNYYDIIGRVFEDLNRRA